MRKNQAQNQEKNHVFQPNLNKSNNCMFNLLILSVILYNLTMHRSVANENIPYSNRSRFSSTNKDSELLTSRSNYNCDNKTLKANIYTKKLEQMHQRLKKKILGNQEHIQQLNSKAAIFKNISSRQEEKLQNCEFRLAKEEYLHQIMTYKQQKSKIESIVSSITEEFNQGQQCFLVEKQKYMEIMSNNQNVMNSVLEAIDGAEKFLQVRQRQINDQNIKIQKNNKIIEEKAIAQKKYFKVLQKIKKKEEIQVK